MATATMTGTKMRESTSVIRPSGRASGGADRVACLALLGQRITVEAGGGIGCRARRVQQDRGERAAHRHRPHDAAGERHRRERLQPIGERHQERQRRGAAEARQCAENQADSHAQAEKHEFPHLEQALDPRHPCIQHAGHPCHAVARLRSGQDSWAIVSRFSRTAWHSMAASPGVSDARPRLSSPDFTLIVPTGRSNRRTGYAAW
jgi:hypothetical protein